SVCDDLFWSRSCPHMPGQVVQLEGGPRVIAELEWRQVRGQETSTVPFAAVHGTRVDDVRALAQLASSKGNTTMDLTELAALLGLQAEASVDALCTAVTALKDRDQTRDRELATLRSRNLELSQKVDAAEAEVAEARQSLAQQQVESIVNEALDSGAVAPGGEVEAQLRDLALSDPDRAKAFVAELAKRPATPVGQPRQQPIGTAPHAGTPQDKASSDQVPGSALTYGHLAGQLKPADLQAAKNCSLSPAEYVRINYDWLSSEYSGWPAKEAD
ncbi:MAG: phage protease, partial [Proteobacteria bacterium]|nr:phage protease [Pseudomonadota bacterium]